jgi:hypothetical protein
MIKPGFISSFAGIPPVPEFRIDELFAELSWMDGGSVIDELFAEMAVESNLGQPLDGVSDVVAAYSLRKIVPTYTGSAIKVRRSSDNAEQDIGFVYTGNPGEYVLDSASLLSFVGANNASVTTWYDQSGNSMDATQTTAANQPRIATSGVIHKASNGLVKVVQIALITEHLVIPEFSGITSAMTNTVYSQSEYNNGSCPWRLGHEDHLPYHADSVAYIGTFSTVRFTYGLWQSPANQAIIATTVHDGSNLSAFRNGSQMGTAKSSTFALPASDQRRIISGAGVGGVGIQEFIITESATNRQAIERNQKRFYTI